jgi:putative transposase
VRIRHEQDWTKTAPADEIALERRRILHFAVTEHPDAAWITQELRKSFPFDTTPRYAILDRDGKDGDAVPAALQSLGVEPVRTAPRSPWQNPYVERFGGTLRRELLDKIVVLNRTQLQRLVREFVTYYHQGRCHLGPEKDAPDPRAVTPMERVAHRPAPKLGVKSES